MKKLRYLLFVLAAATSCFAVEPQSIPLAELGNAYQLVGKLHVPLGEVVTLEGVVVEGPFKGYEGGPNLRVQRILGRTTQEDIQIVIAPFFYEWGEKQTTGGDALPKLEFGATYEMEGYATGEFVGVPDEVFTRVAIILQTTGHYFREQFVVTKAKRIDPIVFAPSMFKGQRALIQGEAQSGDGKAYMVGDGWSVLVLEDTTWPEHVEGKQVEAYGMYNPGSDQKVFQLLDGEWRLVKLEDQIGRNVKLRGSARSLNGVWWFHYRGTDLYVEDMHNLPGWTGENHWRPMVISGRLEKANLPRLDQVSLKPDRDLEEQFIVRNASWTPLASLLSPERPLPSQSKQASDGNEE